MSYVFKPIYWSSDKSSEVIFEPITTLPNVEEITACFVFALHEGGVILVKPGRGWGLPGGHREGDESAEECVRREVLEEAAVELKDLQLVGRWKIQKKFESEFNKKYPSLAYQLLYTAHVAAFNSFEAAHETSERTVVPLEGLRSVFASFDTFEDILDYLTEEMPTILR